MAKRRPRTLARTRRPAKRTTTKKAARPRTSPLKKPSQARRIAAPGKRAPARSRRPAKAVAKKPVVRPKPSPSQTAPAAPLADVAQLPEDRSSRWHAYEMLIHRIESIAGAPVEDMYASLESAGLKGRPFSDMVDHVREKFGISEADAATVVQGYPGHEGPPTELREFLQRRRKLGQERMRGDQPWFA